MFMEAIERLSAAITMVQEARSVPLSASCVLHRGELLEILNDVNSSLPRDLSSARQLLSNRENIIEEGRQSAESLIAHAREEVARMVEQTAIVTAAREEASRLVEDAQIQVERERSDVDAYIDSRLATLEVILNKTLEAVARGRERLAGASDSDVLSQLADD
jgi:cell division septum initiation protein DivIVA